MNNISLVTDLLASEFSVDQTDVWEKLLQIELEELDPGRSAVALLHRLGKPQGVLPGQVLFSHGQAAVDLIVLIEGSVEVTQPEREQNFHRRLPRHHLNEEKGDCFVFEDGKRHKRVRRARAGAVFGAVEYAAVRPIAAPSSPSKGMQVNGDGHNMLNCTAPLMRSTGTVIGGSAKVLIISYESLRQAERQEPVLALVLRTWLSRLTADAVMAMPYADRQHSSAMQRQISDWPP